MTGKNFADGVKLALNVNSQDAPVSMDERTIIWLADKVRNSILPKYLERYGSQSIGSFTRASLIDVKIDTTRDLKYSDITNTVSSIAGDMGIVSVGYSQDDEDTFIISKAGQQAIYSKLYGTSRPKAWQEAGRLYYKNLPFGVTEVLLRCVPQLPSIPIDEEMPIPSDIVDDVIKGVVQMITLGKEDKTNDGTAD
jgi:hypothetical protein